jgi:Cdc6-like AAA superfamily ATPase
MALRRATANLVSEILCLAEVSFSLKCLSSTLISAISRVTWTTKLVTWPSREQMTPMNNETNTQTDWTALSFQIRTLFTPAAPIGRAGLFAGRPNQLTRLLNAIAETGRHGVLFGERGVGKTSLVNVFHEMISGTDRSIFMPIRKQASPSDDYTSLWRKVFRELIFETRRKGDYGNDDIERSSISDLYPNDIEPDDVVREVARFSIKTHPIIVFDEFDRIEDQKTKRVMSHTIKALSDTGVRATVVLVGVADDINTLVEEHASITRNISEIKMPRMSNNELNEILNSRYGKVGMEIAGEARWKIVTLSRGLPEFVHSLGRTAALKALDDRRTKINETDVDEGIKEILEQSDQSANAAYKKAIDSNRQDALYRQVLLACAISRTDDEGKFTPRDVVDPLSGVLGRKVDIANFQNHLGAFSSEERGKILERFGKERAYKYRFRDPKMQPFVLMQGIASGKLGNDALKILSTPEQARLSKDF